MWYQILFILLSIVISFTWQNYIFMLILKEWSIKLQLTSLKPRQINNKLPMKTTLLIVFSLPELHRSWLQNSQWVVFSLPLISTLLVSHSLPKSQPFNVASKCKFVYMIWYYSRELKKELTFRFNCVTFSYSLAPFAFKFQ